MTHRERIIEAEVKTWPQPLQMVYRGMRKAGQSPAMAHMLACQSAPTMGMTSDRQFNSSCRRSMNRMSEHNRDAIVSIAKAAGISTDGKYYVSGIGRYDDPMAWCSTADDVRDACRKKNLTADGPGVRCKGAPVDPPKKKPLADDLARDLERQYLSSDPALAEKCRKSSKAKAELREKIVAKHGRTRSPG